ncbi:MAG: ABC transporter ATP-binding protein [Verrucomicrobia bacterium]|nr:ABC transporter ATP-binding protein [Verrucomicrobiota bacterium]
MSGVVVEDDKDIPQSLWDLIRPFAMRHRVLLILAILLNALPGFAISFQTLVPRYLVDDIIKPDSISTAERLSRLFVLMGIYLGAALLLRMGAWYASFKIFTNVRERVVLELRQRFFRHINGLCLRFYGRHSSGELFTYVMGSPVTEICMYYHNIVINVPNAVTTFLISCIWVFFWDWTLTLVLVFLIALSVLEMRSGSSRLRRLFEDYQRAETKIIGCVADIFRGNRDVKTHAIEDRVSGAFVKSIDQLRSKAYRRDMESHKVNMRPEAIGYMCFVLLCCFGTWRYLTGHLTIGQLVAFLSAFGALQNPLNLLFTVGTMHGQARASFNRLVEVLATSSSTPDPAPNVRVAVPDRADIILRNVSFGYNPAALVLRDINLTIPFGQRVAFVGPSGSGKSTLAKLILRLYDPDEGSVALGSVNLRRCRGAEIRQRFGVVPQDPYFFATTIRENLLLMNPKATSAQLRNVCELANAWEFIAHLAEGLDAPVGEAGARMSGGQRQRLAIARALLHDPRYVIFDEATSSLDNLSEQLVKEALARILRERTAIFIAHRLSTIQNCDRILVLNGGQIVQDGTFAELSILPGLFRRLVENDRFNGEERYQEETIAAAHG